jgi:hypothetical protein
VNLGFSMPFFPVNDDHAIQGASFVLTLSSPLSQATLEMISGNAPWKNDLPAVDRAQAFDVQVNDFGMPRAVATSGFEFSYKRPDGQPSWVLRFMGNQIAVETTLYTRWNPTWGAARGYLFAALQSVVASDVGRENAIISLALVMVDLFRSEEPNSPSSEVLLNSAELPAAVFTKEPLWHSHNGWFAYTENGRTLHHLNIDSRHETGANVSDQPVKNKAIQISHTQTLTFSSPNALTEGKLSTLHALIEAEMTSMHLANKTIVSSILTEKMRSRIGIV